MSYIEEALAKARALAKQAKSQAGGMANYSAKPTTGGINHAAPHMKAQAEGRRMFVGGLSYDTTDESLETYLCTKWPTEECKVKRDPEGKSRGFAFVTFPVLSILEDCFAAGPHWVDGKQVELRKVSPDGSSGAATAGSSLKRGLGGGGGVTRYGAGGSSNTRVFIGQAPGGRSRGLNDDISDEDLRTYFERYGTVTGIAQHRWEDSGRKKGFGYMEFEEYEAAQAALGMHTICGVELEVKQYQQGVPPHRGYTQSAPRNTSQGAPVPTTYNPSGVSSEYGYGGSGNGNGGGYGYGSDAKRSRPDTQGGGGEPQVMDQMKTMMQMMQTMQQQMTARQQPQPPVQSSSVGEQMLQMQQSMYAMMQAQYASNMQQQQQQPSGDTSAQQSGGGTSYPSAAAYQAAQQAQYASSPYGGGYGSGYGGSATSAPKPPGTDRY